MTSETLLSIVEADFAMVSTAFVASETDFAISEENVSVD
jgi:hypothetical protein